MDASKISAQETADISELAYIVGAAGLLQEVEGRPFVELAHLLLGFVFNGFQFGVRISQSQIDVLNSIKGKVFLGTGCIMVLDDFEIKQEEKVKTKFFGLFGKKIVTRRYLASADLRMFNKKGRYWGHAMRPPLYFLAHHEDFLQRLKDWEDIVASIYADGWEFKPAAFEHNDYY